MYSAESLNCLELRLAQSRLDRLYLVQVWVSVPKELSR
jgi:hypothetical protein